MSTLAPPSPRFSLHRSIVLIGLMGAGKSSVGARLAELLQVRFADSDAEIERAAAMPISEIFERFGEPHFRDGERRVIARLLALPPQIIATGGGAYMDAETRALIATEAVSVWLNADLDLLVQRTTGRTHRPLLARGNPREVLAGLIDLRYPVYAQADVAVQSQAGQSHDDMAELILAALQRHGAETGRPVLGPRGTE